MYLEKKDVVEGANEEGGCEIKLLTAESFSSIRQNLRQLSSGMLVYILFLSTNHVSIQAHFPC